MRLGGAPKRFGEHGNAFGFLRLALASLVIVAHTPELHDGDRHRELLSRLFGSLTFGELAVDGFFIVSGFLITASVRTSAGPGAYLRKRVARIYPAFAACSLFCMVVVGPLSGAYPPFGVLQSAGAGVLRVAILCPPLLAHVFTGMPYPALNGAAWTLQYEFGCYLLILGIHQAGLLSLRWVGAAAAICLAICAAMTAADPHSTATLPISYYVLQGRVVDLPRLTGLFLCGACFRLRVGALPLSAPLAGVALLGLLAALSVPPLAHPGVALFGGYLLFAIAAAGAGTWLARVNDRNDISYGLYLYAWPIEKLLLWWRVSDNLLVLGALTWALAAGAGALSWFLLEKPVMRRVRPRPVASDAASTRTP